MVTSNWTQNLRTTPHRVPSAINYFNDNGITVLAWQCVINIFCAAARHTGQKPTTTIYLSVSSSLTTPSQSFSVLSLHFSNQNNTSLFTLNCPQLPDILRHRCHEKKCHWQMTFYLFHDDCRRHCALKFKCLYFKYVLWERHWSVTRVGRVNSDLDHVVVTK